MGSNPGLRLGTVLLAALSLSIGWGIRGNFGHEYGAMIPGALTAITVCLCSGRDDWRARVAYFAMFGALGWGFGGSISYMQVIAYTHSGHWPSQLYGFFGLFWIGFLWAGLGGAGTALPAVADRERLTQLFRPLCWVFVAWTSLVFLEGPVVEWYRSEVWGEASATFDRGARRQESPFYWFDADWLPALFAVTATCLFDLWERRKEPAAVPILLAFAASGALAGWGVQTVLHAAKADTQLLQTLVHQQGDLTYVNPETGRAVDPENLLNNWPQFFLDIGPHLGWVIGIVIGLAIYFAVFGKFSCGSSLFLHMGLGWLIAFVIMPVLLSNAFKDYGGFRMTPPRGDDWAGITGVWIGAITYLLRRGLKAVAYASMVSAFIGGLGFATAQWLKLMAIAPGNPLLVNPQLLAPGPTATAGAAWKHWQSANWHSFLEQCYGFINGIAIAVAIGLLITRVPKLNGVGEGGRLRGWTSVFAVAFVLLLVPYVNLVKNVQVWVEGKLVPATMKAPLFERIELPAATWFNLTCALLAVAVLWLLIESSRRPIDIVPRTWLGRGQLLYLVFLWVIVIGNFERALPGFREQRLLTEWVVIINAVIATVLVLTLPRAGESVEIQPVDRYGPIARFSALLGLVASAVVLLAEFGTVRLVYGDHFSGHAGRHTRFGPDAEWRTNPNLRNAEHR
jgi:hypothetical protein